MELITSYASGCTNFKGYKSLNYGYSYTKLSIFAIAHVCVILVCETAVNFILQQQVQPPLVEITYSRALICSSSSVRQSTSLAGIYECYIKQEDPKFDINHLRSNHALFITNIYISMNIITVNHCDDSSNSICYSLRSELRGIC